jgi:hypothetical protein
MEGRVRRDHGLRVNPALQRERQEAQRMNEEKRRERDKKSSEERGNIMKRTLLEE